MSLAEEKVLGITKAARILGVHPLTLRSWADQGHLTYLKTPGGHRRFRQKDIEQFLAKMNQGTPESNLVTVAQEAVQKAIATLPDKEPIISQPIRRLELSEPKRVAMRSVGQKLLGLTIQYVSGGADEAILNKGQEIGSTYGKFARLNGMTISETVATFNFFRDTIIEATFSATADLAHIDASNPQLYRRLNRFFNEVLLSTVQIAEEVVPEVVEDET